MSKVAIASISDQGWVTDSSKILNAVMSQYILTDAMQSVVFTSSLTSLPKTYYKFINEPESMAAGVRDDLDKLLSKYFPMVEVETQTKMLTDKSAAVLIYAAVIDDAGIKVELSKVAQVSTSGLRKAIDMSNYGTGRAYIASL